MSLRKTGIDIIGDVPWGTHLCQFYQTKEDLTDILIPYFKTGLENNEFCLWVTSDLLDEQEALQVMREAVPDFGQYLEKGQIGIIPHAEWYLKYKSFSPQMILNGGLKEIDQVLANGYDGIRVAGNAAWLAKKDCKSLNDHHKVADNARGQYPIMVICAYPLDKCGASEAIDVVKNHHLSLIKQGDQWQVVGSSVHERIDRAPPGSEQEYRHLFESTLDGLEVIDAETGKIALANQAVARMFGFDSPEELIGLNPLQYIPVEDRERVAGMMAEHMFGEDLHQVMELRALNKDGREIWISAIGVRTEYQGRLAGIVSMRDITVQKLAEKALLDSKEELQAIFDGVKEGIAILDRNGKVVRVNSRVLEVGEYTEEDIIGKTFNRLQMLSPQSIAQTLSVQAEILSGQKVPPFESKVYSGSGRELDLEVQVTPLRQREELVGSIVVLRDITEHKQSEEKLRASEEKNRLLVENASEGIAVVQDGVLRFANRKLADFISYPLEEVINKPFGEIVHPDDRQMVMEHYVNRLKGEEVPPVYQFRVIDKGGNTRWAEINAVLFNWEGSPAVLCFLNDVTESKQADEALQESERRYRLLAENALDVIWTMDMELRPTYVSPSITHMLGHSVDEAMARKVEQSLTPASLEIALKALSEGLSTADTNTEGLCRSRTMELEMIRKNGSTIWTEVEASFLRNSDGQPSGIMVMARDITERKQAEEQLHQSFYNLEKTLEGTIQAITLMVETRDRYTAGHQQRVTQLACTIAREMGLSSKQIQTIRIAGLLHDLGKIFIPTEILSKPGRLTDIEFAIIKTHPKAGYDILKNIDFPWPIADIVVQHHERMNGSGYPSGLQGEEITLEARILAVSDVIEAMASHRPYRPSLGLDRALKEVIDNKGVLYDSDVVDACLKVFVEKRFKLGEELATSSAG